MHPIRHAVPLFAAFALALPCAAQVPKPLFDGTSLKGWTVLGDGSWSVSGGEIVARQTPANAHFTHLVSDTSLKDFRVSFLFKSTRGNAGFFFRQSEVPADPDKLAGVQAVIDPALQAPDAFGLYETNGREWLRKWDFARHQKQYSGGNGCMMKHDWPKLTPTSGLADSNCRMTLYAPGEWNRMSVWAKGPRVIVKLNMRTIVDTSDPALDRAGRFAFKLHMGQDVEIRFKDIEVSPWPEAPPGLRPRLRKALLYKGEAGVSPAPVREFLREIGKDNGFAIDEGTESAFTQANLAQYQAALFVSDYNVNFNAAQRADFQAWFGKDRGAMCMHACTRQEVSIAWPWWGEASGGRLADHTPFISRSVALDAEAAKRPLWKGFSVPEQRWRDEWFHWVASPRGKPGVTVLLDYADDGAPSDQAPKGLPHGWIDEAAGGRFFAWGGMHTMNALELPFTYDFLLRAMWDIGGLDTVGTALHAAPRDLGESRIAYGASLRVECATPSRAELRGMDGSLAASGSGNAGVPLEIRAPAHDGVYVLRIRGAAGASARKVLCVRGRFSAVP